MKKLTFGQKDLKSLTVVLYFFIYAILSNELSVQKFSKVRLALEVLAIDAFAF